MAQVVSGFSTDVGKTRQVNEDSVYVGEFLWAVADGMGGHAAGDVASQLVVAALRAADRPNLDQQAIIDALRSANEAVRAYGMEVPAARGLGSTVSGLARIFLGGAEHWAVFNVGDSRVYRIYEGALSRATVDHSEVEELVLQGRLTEEQARAHSSRSVITRSIGTDPPPIVDLWVLPQGLGEGFLICSDGLTSELPDQELQEILSQSLDVHAMANRLKDAALSAGGRDNVSVIVLNVEQGRDLGNDATNPRSLLTGERA